MKRLAGAAELLDGKLEPSTLRGNLRDLVRVNRLLGGAALSWRSLRPLLSATAETSLLDVGTGAADIPVALLRRARRSGDRLRVVASDVRPEIVSTAQAAVGTLAGLELKLGSADRIDEETGSFDVAHASLVMHHLEPAAAVTLLREMARVARKAVIVNDLDRGVLWWLGAWLLAHVATGNGYTRHDAPLSVRRAYRPGELRQLAERAGLVESARYRARPPYRYAIVFNVKRGTDA
jgi:ubiquinone/menaquinone biosynthesis C-methylase UbiE